MNASSEHPSNPGAQATYFAYLAQGEFMIQRCGQCAKHVFYPRTLCTHCGSERLQWVRPSGRGTVYSTSVVRKKKEEGGDYNVVLVDLEEDVRLMSRVDGIAPDRVAIGMPVQAKVVTEDGAAVLIFLTVGEQS